MIIDNVQIFYPEYSENKIYFYINKVKVSVSSYCHYTAYPEEDTFPDLDVFVADKTIQLIRRDEQGYIKSRNLEGYAETLMDNGEMFTDDDKLFLNKYFQYLQGYDNE